jgi:hypothetical protein
MKPIPAMVGAAIVGVIVSFAVLWTWLLVDTWNASEKLDPSGPQASLTPILAGGLGLLFALALGVDPNVRGAPGFWARLRAVFKVGNLLVVGAVVYGLAALAGVVVWAEAGDDTPELVSTLVLVAAGYAVAAMTALARA